MRPGDSYHQRAEEIHYSEPADGTVTIIQRMVPVGANPDIARVYYDPRVGWKDASARRATAKEVQRITEKALEQWFGQTKTLRG